jgi:ABC-type nitrate/sulfonate/bicarbonate transport system permease component
MSRAFLSRAGRDMAERALPIAALLAVWQIAVALDAINPAVLPSPLAIARAAMDLLNGGELLSNLATTVLVSFAGLAGATIIGVPLGVVMARSRLVNGLFGPLAKATYSLPKTALVPLFFLWFGIGSLTNSIAVALACLLPLLVYTHHGVQAVPRILIWSARSMGTPPRKIFRHVILPASLHAVLTGLRIALGFSFVVAISAEMIATNNGIGKLMIVYGESGAYDYMFAAIAALVVVAFLADRALVALSAHLLRWQQPDPDGAP